MKHLAPLAAAALVLILYAPALRLPGLGEWYEEQSMARLSTFHLGLLDRPVDFYYRPATRWVDHAWYRLWDTFRGGRCPLVVDRALFVATHAATAALLGWIALRRTGSAGAGVLATWLYGLHPLLVSGVAYASTRWTVLVPLLFLLIAAAYERAFARPPGRAPLLFFLAMAPTLLLLALLSELGALAMGCLGAWLLVRCRQRGESRFALACLAPLAVVPVLYLALRHLALGSAFQPYAYRELALGERLLGYCRNLVFDLTLLLAPLRLPVALGPDATAARVILAAGACLGLAGWLFAREPARRFLAARPLPALTLALFAPLQLNGLWLLEREPVAVAGFDRGHVYSLAWLALSLLAAEAFAALAGARRQLVGACLAVFAAASFVATSRTLALWQQAGDLLRSHERQLAPFLHTLAPHTTLSVRGFPALLKAPHLAWAYAYFYVDRQIFSTWAGKPLEVYWEQGDAPPPLGFSGPVLENVGGRVRIGREDALEAVASAVAHGRARGQGPSLALLARPDDRFGAQAAQVTRLADGSLRVRLLGDDAWLVVPVEIESEDYGVLRYEVRTLEAQPKRLPPHTQLYFQPRGGAFDEFLSVTAPVSLDPEWREVRLPLFEVPRWRSAGGIEALRLDPLERPGVIEIRGLRLENDLEWALWEEARLRAARAPAPPAGEGGAD